MPRSLSVWWHRKKLRTEFRQPTRAVTAHRIVNPYHAVSIEPGADCCSHALETKDTRFLSAEAPAIPLTGCDAPACACVYAHHDDRRSGKERRKRISAPADNRRVGHGRRHSDG